MSRYVLYTAVLPEYRNACLDVLRERLGDSWQAYAGDQHLDSTVRSATPENQYVRVQNYTLFGRRVLLQLGSWSAVLRADAAILDLNPRSLSAWLLLLTRRVLRRRTLLWGHLHPRSGASSRTAGLRRRMRRLGDGCIVYSYADAESVRAESPEEAVWVAPNALYRRAEIGREPCDDRQDVLYVGRLERAKKPGLLLTAFAMCAADYPRRRLVLIGDGNQREILEKRTAVLGIAHLVSFPGSIQSRLELRARYARAICSVSPGYAGLALTQSLCFGVPMLVADAEPHAPEIELARLGGVTFFRSNSPEDLSEKLRAPDLLLADRERDQLIRRMREGYSAEAMAA